MGVKPESKPKPDPKVKPGAAVTEEEVRHVAALARLGVTDEQIASFTSQLSGILGHMEVLSKVDVSRVTPAVGVGSGGTPLRTDQGPQYKLAHEHEKFAPRLRDGFYVVPRLSTHEDEDQAVTYDDGENYVDPSVLDEDSQRHQADALDSQQKDAGDKGGGK